ncbi:asparagine synthase (glutamine-hydrolyzing) [Candidatus Microgenomates bacterium]|nr:asparagine synthase (glutamine-hydrolyzing) [Candidatus Microgenomates bacterium]
MCAIYGFVGFKDQRLLQKMSRLLVHRGPDDSGFYSNGIVSLGHRRLAIIDLSQGGHQPFVSEDKNAILAANGEIYNFKELRRDLEDKGHRFGGKSDNEVILHAYEEWGLDFVKHFIGIFAFAIWNKRRKTLILVRDHLGVKPLYFALVNGCLIFASEAKAILAWKKIKKEIDPVSIDTYLSLRYLPGDKTMFSQIRKLSAGSILIFKEGKIKVSRYWQPTIHSSSFNKNEARNQLERLLRASISSQMVADVPVGAYLSGGIDSSIVTSLAQRKHERKIKTFTLGFNSSIDETHQAIELAKRLKTDYHHFSVIPKNFTLLPEIVSFLDEPIGDPIIMPIYLLAGRASKEVKVVLTGDGADEIFGGYIHHLGIFWKEKLQKFLPASFLAFGVKFIPSKIIDRIFPYPASVGEKGKRRLTHFLKANSLFENYFTFANLFTQEDKKKLYTKNFAKHLIGKKSIEAELKRSLKKGSGDFLSRIIVFDVLNWLPDYILYMADRLSMAHGLEARVPYLDYRLVEFALSLPSDFKIKRWKNKLILREAMAGVLPPDVLKRPKRSFFVPIEQFWGKEMLKLFSKTLSRKVVEKRGLFNFEYIESLKKEFKKSPLLLGKQLMALVIFELWWQKFADEKIN